MKIVPLDKGIEEVMWEGAISDGGLPETASFIPSEISPEHLLDEILYARSHDEHIIASLAPRLLDREITAPSRYHDIGESARRGLCAIMESTGSPEKKEILQKAVELLDEQKNLKSMLDSYRMLLMHG